MARILITGANSFVGTNYIRYSGFGDITEVCLQHNRVEDINFGDYDSVLHVAALVHQSKRIPEEEYFHVNRDLAVKAAEEARKAGVKQFIFLSTVKVFGERNPEDKPWNEISECRPEYPYGRSKFEAEKALRELEDENFSVAVIRPALVYGPGVKANMRGLTRLVRIFPVLPFGGIHNRRSYVCIENLVALIDHVVKQSAHGIFIAVDDQPVSTSELARFIAEAMPRKICLFRIPAFMIRLGKIFSPSVFDRLYGNFEVSNELTREQLKFESVVTTKEGIRRMVKG